MQSKEVRRERSRIQAIIASPEAAGREALAHRLAFETDKSPEEAVAMLKAANTDNVDGASNTSDSTRSELEEGAALYKRYGRGGRKGG